MIRAKYEGTDHQPVCSKQNIASPTYGGVWFGAQRQLTDVPGGQWAMGEPSGFGWIAECRIDSWLR